MEKTIEQRIEELEKKVAELEGRVQEQPEVKEIVKKIVENLETSIVHIP